MSTVDDLHKIPKASPEWRKHLKDLLPELTSVVYELASTPPDAPLDLEVIAHLVQLNSRLDALL